MKWLFKHLVWLVTLGLCLLSSGTLSLIDSVSSQDLIFILPSVILTVFQVIYFYLKRAYEDILKSIMPFLYFLFFMCEFHLQWGNGHTGGILGYSKRIGLFTQWNISIKMGAVFYSISYILISIAIIFKYYFVFEKICYNADFPKKVVTSIISILCVISIIYYWHNIVHCGFYLRTIIFYYLGYLFFRIIYIIETWKS